MDDIVNYDEVKQQILAGLTSLKETPHRSERPLIYHLGRRGHVTPTS